MVPYHRPIPEPKQRGKGSGLINAWIQAESLMQIALVLPCATFIGWLGGGWLDHVLHQHWISLVGIIFGGASGLVYVIRLAYQASKNPAMQDEDSGESADNNKAGKGSADSGS
jgi:ATP synthase protein I